jgi:hypothetical protein
MIKLSMEEACKKLHWHDSSASFLNFDEAKQELTIELELCDGRIDEDDNVDDVLLFNGQTGSLVFHGISDFEIDTIIPAERNPERAMIEFSGADCISKETKNGLRLVGYSYKDIRHRSYDWFTLSFFADSATWYPKTNN